jgi:proteasome lid subunit RPN8/RPN11
MILWLTDAQATTIIAHARAEAPHEACGLIGGVGYQAQQVIPIPNIAADPRRHYEMDPRALTNTLFALEHGGKSLLAFYHSHPFGDPIPSPTDVAQAYYPDTVYLIVGLREPDARLAAWHIHNGQVDPVTLHIGAQPPDMPPDSSLSRAQTIAIIISALLALILMLTLSLSLLPPAPPIPSSLP